jgi:hypothetical protein
MSNRPHDTLEVADAAGQPVDPGDHEHVALVWEVEHGAQFLAPRRSAPLLSTDDLAAAALLVCVAGGRWGINDPRAGKGKELIPGDLAE